MPEENKIEEKKMVERKTEPNKTEKENTEKNITEKADQHEPQIKSIAGHIIADGDKEFDEKKKKKPESVLDVDEHMTEKEKFGLMDSRQKREYIMEYYVPKILFALVVVGIITFLIVKHFTAGNASLNIVVVNTTGKTDTASDKAYYEEFLDENGYDPDKEYVSVSTGIGVSTDPNDAMSQNSLQLIQNKFMANAVDVFFADTELVLSLGEFGYMQNLDTVLSDELKAKYKDSLVYATVIETGEKMPVGIKIADNNWVRDTGWYGDDVTIGFGENARNMELALKFLEYISER